MSCRNDALSIWHAGVDAVRSDQLICQQVQADSNVLHLGNQSFEWDRLNRIVVVGAGKAGAGMADGLEQSLGPDRLAQHDLTGWINVPDDCLRPLTRIRLHGARPAGRNEPTLAGVEGSKRILELVGQLNDNDLCICLISGGGSALLPAPIDEVTLDDLLLVTQQLSALGATISELNAVRKRLSRIQGGRLAEACTAGNLVSLIISDVLGDPLQVIASGPTVIETDPVHAAQKACEVYDRFRLTEHGVRPAVRDQLQKQLEQSTTDGNASRPSVALSNQIIGNNATAVQAAAEQGRSMGYSVITDEQRDDEVTAAEAADGLLAMLRDHRPNQRPWCFVSGGEPVVQLVCETDRGKGGRNQQLVITALDRLQSEASPPECDWAMLSGGTDGEDGPTDAAGAIIDRDSLNDGPRNLREYRSRNDAYHFFEQSNGLIKTGPTHTNVCDLRVIVAK